MSAVAKFENLKDLIVQLRGESVLLDADVAKIYGVETRDINKAVTNNPDKFPEGYVIEVSKPEKSELVENFHRFNKLKHSTVNPKAFPESKFCGFEIQAHDKEKENMRKICIVTSSRPDCLCPWDKRVDWLVWLKREGMPLA